MLTVGTRIDLYVDRTTKDPDDMKNRVRILLIVKDPNVADEMSASLVRSGYDVCEARDIERGLELFSQEKFNLVCLYMTSDIKKCYTAIRTMRALNSETLLIVVSDNSTYSLKEQILKAGADTVIRYTAESRTVWEQIGFFSKMASNQKFIREKSLQAEESGSSGKCPVE